MYFYISLCYSLIFYSQIVCSGGYLDSSNKYPDTPFDQINEFNPGSSELDLINILTHHRYDLRDNADTMKNSEPSDPKTSIYSSRVGSPVGAVGVENTIINKHNDKLNSLDNSRILPVVTDMRNELTRIINDTIFYNEYSIDTTSDNYIVMVHLFVAAHSVSKSPDGCDIANASIKPFRTRGDNLRYVLGLGEFPIEYFNPFLLDFHNLYENSLPYLYTGKLYTTDSSCSRLVLSRSASSEYFASPTGRITAKDLAFRVETLCEILEEFEDSEVSYKNMVIPNELNSRFEEINGKVSDVNDPIHQSSTKISDFCHELTCSPQIESFITDNTHASDYISCHVRRVFNVASMADNDYRLCVASFESLIKGDSATGRLCGSTTTRTNTFTQVPNIRN